jgi:hypothetical protein
MSLTQWATILYTCFYSNPVQVVPATCQFFGSSVYVLCQYYAYPSNHVYCTEGTHQFDLCERALDQVQILPTGAQSVEECSADPAALEAACDANAPSPVVSGIAQCGQ